ncbi:hypothetical protein M434DRAFT_18362 [Hypoxylon sp. CO27-5]|nr:hypothetical protein M434DRAFT_18362 [Hypoxylon sp. CO27-5]
MDPDADADADADESGPLPPPPASQASSHFPLLEPASGATLFELEAARRERLKLRGRLKVGCDEIDEKALLGGFERGEVVGVSAEEAEFGLLVGLQTVAHAMVFGTIRRAAIITTLPATAILPTLRDVIRTQVQARLGPTANHRLEEVNAEVRRCLELISVSRVFDVEGLWEVLSELETPPSPAPPAATVDAGGRNEDGIPIRNEEAPLETPGRSTKGPAEGKNQEAAKSTILPSLRASPIIKRTEVRDSDEDEDEELSPSSSLSPPPQSPQVPLPSSPPSAPAAPTPISMSISTGEQEDKPHIPDLILITHFSSLLTNLFTRSADNKTSAHTTLQLLSSHLRFLARSSSGPLIMLLNTTTSTTSSSPSSASNSTTTTTGTTQTTTSANTASHNNPTTPATASKPRPLEPTLRSIFNSAPISGAGAGGGGGVNRRQNKPAFGATFAQFLDLHLLCTRVPRTRADAEALFAPATAAAGVNEVRYCWVVEILLDVSGVWERDGDGTGQGIVESKGKSGQHRTWTRKSREQRWGAVGVRGGVRLIDAFQRGLQETWAKGPVRVAAGFGGPPPRGL